MNRKLYANHRNKDEKTNAKGFNADTLANNSTHPHA